MNAAVKVVLSILFLVRVIYTFFQSLFGYSYKNTKDKIILFTRLPEEGKTKTRMFSKLSPKECCELQSEMTKHMIKKISRLYSKQNFDFEISYNSESKNGQKLMENWLGKEYKYKKQIGSNLGEKLKNSFQSSFQSGFENVIILGSDIPDIDHRKHLSQAFSLLRNSTDSVVGPSEDGGYYLIGLNKKQCENKNWEELFNNITWGTKYVFDETVSILKTFNISVSLLEKLNDVDYPEDLEIWNQSKLEMKSTESVKISIIIPVLNESENLKKTVSSLSHGVNIEIIGILKLNS
jgi:uncharacterized protein